MHDWTEKRRRSQEAILKSSLDGERGERDFLTSFYSELNECYDLREETETLFHGEAQCRRAQQN